MNADEELEQGDGAYAAVDVPAVLATVAAAAVPALADYCVAFYIGDGHGVRAIAEHGRVSADEARALAPWKDGLGWHVGVVPPLDGQTLVGRLEDALVELPAGVAFASVLVAPLIDEDYVIGGLVLAARAAGKHGPAQIDFADAVACSTSLVLATAVRYERARLALYRRNARMGRVGDELTALLRVVAVGANLFRETPLELGEADDVREAVDSLSQLAGRSLRSIRAQLAPH